LVLKRDKAVPLKARDFLNPKKVTINPTVAKISRAGKLSNP
jgi:hypothetical protein